MVTSHDEHTLAPRLGGHQQAGKSGDEPELSGARPHLFIVDDNALLLPMLEMVLHRNGFRATCIADAYQAVALLRFTRPDVLLSDLIMPGLSGLAVLEAARQMPHLAALPMFLWTYGGGIRHDHPEVLRLGVRVIDVPVWDMEEFYAMMREEVRNAKRGGYSLGRLNR